MFIKIDWEDLGYKFCDLVVRLTPRIITEFANSCSWHWKAMTGTLYPPGVFVLATYLVFFVVLFLVLEAAMKVTGRK